MKLQQIVNCICLAKAMLASAFKEKFLLKFNYKCSIKMQSSDYIYIFPFPVKP